MSLSSNLERLEDAARNAASIEEAIANLRHGVTLAEQLRDAVLANHRERHTTVAPQFCDEACRLAADW
jgi:hypothetical protein